MEKDMIIQKIKEEYALVRKNSDAKTMDQLARSLYSILPKDRDQLIQLFDELVSRSQWGIFWLITKWIKRKKLYEFEYMDYYEKWLHNYIKSWGQCDVFCYRVLNPMVEKYPQFFDKVMQWTESSKTYVRRAAPVSLLHSTRSFQVNVSWEKVLRIVEKLKGDEELHVQKGIGWLLKYAYLTYPEEVYQYLLENVNGLTRVAFRYALEKTPKHIKDELMNL